MRSAARRTNPALKHAWAGSWTAWVSRARAFPQRRCIGLGEPAAHLLAQSSAVRNRDSIFTRTSHDAITKLTHASLGGQRNTAEHLAQWGRRERLQRGKRRQGRRRG